MQIIHDFITPNPFSRPQRPLENVRGVVMHWTEAPEQNEKQVRDFFDSRKDGYGSAHYVIGQNGICVACIPENEIAYHCGTDKKDPQSGKVYTDLARQYFGTYASEQNSPNNCTLSVELCPIDSTGRFSPATLATAAELVADICTRYRLSVTRILTHHDIVGWKDCPKYWTEHPLAFTRFLVEVIANMRK